MANTPAQKEEARLLFQAHLDKLNTDNPPSYDPPHFLSIFRHPCAAQRNVSKAIDLKEVRLTATEANHPELEPWAFIWKEGTCKKAECSQVARSTAGRLINSIDRPPISGRVSRA